VAVIAKGRVVAEGTPASIGGRDTGAVRICFGLPPGVAAAALPVPAREEGGEVVVETADPVGALHALTGWALERKLDLRGLSVSRPSLEDVYLGLVGE